MAAPSAVDYVKRSGPEDHIAVVKTSSPASWRTGPGVEVTTANVLSPKELKEIRTLGKFISTEPYASIIRDLASARRICSKQRMIHSMCLKDQPSHLGGKVCAGEAMGVSTCFMKL